MKTLIDALEAAGGNYWSKGEYERVYFNTKEAYALAGGKVSMYVSGRVESAFLPNIGRVSNSKAFIKAYYDLVKDEVVVSGINPDVEDEIREAVEALVSEIKSKKEKEEAQESSPQGELEEKLLVEVKFELEGEKEVIIKDEFPIASKSKMNLENANKYIKEFSSSNLEELSEKEKVINMEVCFSFYRDYSDSPIYAKIHLDLSVCDSETEIYNTINFALSKSIDYYYNKYCYPL